MNDLVEQGLLAEMDCGANFSYILADNHMFLPTEYKVLQSQTGGGFVPCMKMLFNGKIQLYYLTSPYRTLDSMLPHLEADSFMTIAANLFGDIITVKSNGFLSCQNIEISFERIYIDAATYKVSLLYVPLSKRMFAGASSFENELRTSLVKLISSVPALSSLKTNQLCADLSNGSLSLEDLYSGLRSGKSEETQAAPTGRKETGGSSGRLRIVAMNAPARVELEITKPEFVIGKNPAAVDGVLSFNRMISRIHCKISRSGSQYMIMDLQSANGTYVNRVRLQPNVPYPIKNGDIIRLANSDFQVIMG